MIKEEKIRIAIAFASVVLSVASSVNAGGSPQKPIPVTGAKAWALACPAILAVNNKDYSYRTLATQELTLENILKERKLLAQWWGVTSQAGLIETLSWLDRGGGHRKSFNKIGLEVSGLNEKDFQVLLDKCGKDNEKRQELQIARQYYKKLGKKSIAGWDYVRYISLCRWGYTAGYITEQQAWEKIMPAARKLQKTFDSWEDLGNNYLIGRQFWSYNETKESGELFKKILDYLLKSENSPWTVLSWNMDLSENQDPNSADKKGLVEPNG